MQQTDNIKQTIIYRDSFEICYIVSWSFDNINIYLFTVLACLLTLWIRKSNFCVSEESRILSNFHQS